MSGSASRQGFPPQAAIQGDLFQQGSGKSTPALLRIAQEHVVITRLEDGTPLTSETRASIEISDRVGKIARRISLSGGSVFVTHDNDGVDRLIGTSARSRSVNWLERFHPRLAFITLVALALVFGVFRYGLPVAISAAVAVTPDAVIKQISKGSLAGFEGVLFQPTKISQQRRDKLQSAFRALVTHSSDRVRSLEPSLNFRSSAIGPNAFALPDGTIIVTDALLKLADDEAVIGVLGHELGHVHHQHGLRLIYRSAGFAAMIALIAGDVGGVLEDVLLQGAGILTLSYNRSFEHQADSYSVDLLTRAGHNPSHILNFFEVMKKRLPDNKIVPDWLSTHPSTNRRIEKIKELTDKQ